MKTPIAMATSLRMVYFRFEGVGTSVPSFGTATTTHPVTGVHATFISHLSSGISGVGGGSTMGCDGRT
jgi:hypothetical protein